MVTKLPTFRGYTIDRRLREFRRIKRGEPWVFIPFTSKRGKKLLAEYVHQGDDLTGLFQAAKRIRG